MDFDDFVRICMGIMLITFSITISVFCIYIIKEMVT